MSLPKSVADAENNDQHQQDEDHGIGVEPAPVMVRHSGERTP